MTVKTPLLAGVLAVCASLLAVTAAQPQGASVRDESAIPPPPVLLVTPRLVPVPDSAVRYAPGVAFNLFAYQGRSYSFHHGAWFQAPSPRGPWKVVALDRVPFAVRAVPVAYYKIPPAPGRRAGR
jgi:hypothetical protein